MERKKSASQPEMNRLLPALLFLVLFSWGPLAAAEPPGELDPKEAAKLIALVLDTRDEGIAIATIVEGSKQEDGKFEARHVRRVTAIHPVNESGRRVRRVRCYDFYWNEAYGWFVWEKREGKGGEEVWIWSETQGDLVVK